MEANNQTLTGYRDRLSFRFFGIRYAPEPKRFTYPTLFNGSGEQASALQYGSQCIQGSNTGSEDCLFLNVLVSIIFTFCVIFQCTPVSHFWTGWDGLHEGYCLSQWTMFLAGGIIATALDIYFVVLPIPLVIRLQLSRPKKLLTAGMLSLGIM